MASVTLKNLFKEYERRTCVVFDYSLYVLVV